MRFFKVLLLTFILISLNYANPILVSYLSEIQAAPDSLQRIELYAIPSFGGGINLGGWTIHTHAGVATINPNVFLPVNGYVTIDATNTTGIFHINENNDVVSIYSNNGYLIQSVSWPSSQVNWNHAPAPPIGGSICLYRNPDYYFNLYLDVINWYVDSTPTLNMANDDYSIISGRLLNSQGQGCVNYYVYADGRNGQACNVSDNQGYYNLLGLGEGKYWITVWRYQNQNFVQVGNYPESIYVGYSQHLSNININLPISDIREDNTSIIANLIFLPNPFRTNSKLLFSLPFEDNVRLSVYDIKGSLLKTLLNQRMTAGPYQIQLDLKPGVYFLNFNFGKHKFNRKITVFE